MARLLKSRRVITNQHGQHINEKKKKKNSNNKEIYRERPKSFDESILLTHNSSTNSHDSKSSSGSYTSSSVFSGFDSDVPSEAAEKKAYPLPTPSSLSSEPSMKYNEELTMFGSEMVLRSSTNSPVSFFPTSSIDDAPVHDHEDFGPFSAVEETKCRNSWTRTSSPGSKALTAHRSPLPPIWDAGFESPSKKQENNRHPCHPLPLPPSSPTKSYLNLLSNWKKGKLIGRGTFGHVYAAFNSENGQMCAMKEVRVISDDQNSNECLKQLNQEIALVSELSHPNIVQYYGSKLGGDKLSVYLEYVSGGSIHKLLGEYGPFSEPVIQNYTKQILSGLAYLHGRKTVHRDIKGANILVDPNGHIKLVDFGMAKHVIKNTSGYSLAVDIWSLGCTILEMATSKPPWSQYEGVAAIFKISNSKDYPEIPSHLSEDARAFVKLCLQRDPSHIPKVFSGKINVVQIFTIQSVQPTHTEQRRTNEKPAGR
ncbi:unnamed protein product [Dovyalis caffra]|uniref:mitogen-activated protein kinase kinase kinase n=1 Tax=Dovyalis caffra TaxID=77055 RepID=A0AAV1S5W9_9ROSI|nr:unnamed protein product [Dovyalis caffra]